ncbi:glycosyltransferase family 4 protein [Pelomonas sp. P7]|uniref:Glycosyltransferase family 4 protein n=1 Tax=Pelomonas caseinilytica TaxID=2906763 RepID=A0ABS8XH85_9BURK|nr:glycosyltransferase family 4 protein [Pelomonas sp. P7]
MRIAVFAPDCPFPPDRGGRADVWRRLLALRGGGHELMLVHLYEPAGPLAPKPQDLTAMDAHLARRFAFPIKRGPWRTLRQLAASPWLPWHAATRVPEGDERAALDAALQSFSPEVLLLEGPWFGEMVKRTADRLSVPYLYRSHNVEHRYLRGQARAAGHWRDRIAWRLACIGLERYELELMRGAHHVFDISQEDRAFWAARGVRGSWLPPVPEQAFRERPERLEPSEVLFLGNLRTPNNVRGLRWLIAEVLPLLRVRRPETCLTVVGSRPTPELAQELQAQPGVRLRADQPDVQPWLFGARVLVNPVATGSGVQLKTLDMLMTDAPIVSRAQGLSGLPESFASLLRIAETPAAFADEILAALQFPAPPDPARVAARAQFTPAGVNDAVEAALAGARA